MDRKRMDQKQVIICSYQIQDLYLLISHTSMFEMIVLIFKEILFWAITLNSHSTCSVSWSLWPLKPRIWRCYAIVV